MGKGHHSPKAVQELPRWTGGGTAVHLHHVPAADHIPGREVLEGHPRQRRVAQGVHLHQVARPLDRVAFGQPPSPGPSHLAPVPSQGAAVHRGWLHLPAPPQIGQDTPHCGLRDGPSLPLEQTCQLLLAPGGVSLVLAQDRHHHLRRPVGPPPAFGPAALLLQPFGPCPCNRFCHR
jgi:hypothetical protein